MKTSDGCYRFSLQFASNSEEYIRVGEMLERLKHKKSDFIVRAVCEYLERHPEIEAAAPLQIEVRRELFRRDELEKIVRGIVQQYVSVAGIFPTINEPQTPSPTTPLPVFQQEVDSAVSMMLDNLDEFL